MNLKFLILPIACGISFLPYSSADSAFRTNNNTVMAGRYGAYSAQVAPSVVASVPTPTSVDTTSAELEACQMIYPTGEFQIARPTIGLRAGGENQCVSVVKLVGYQMGPAGSNLVFATANVAAGDSFKCNIDSFPETSMNEVAVESVEFPRDEQPTVDDVIETMNQEQKQNAGIKIAAAAIVGGLSGNLFGKNDIGRDNMLGLDKGKLEATGIGVAGGAALMAASTYSGKVAGDVILSTGVNAAAGAIIGNGTSAFGDGSALRVEKECKIQDKKDSVKNCLWGVIQTGKDVSASDLAGAFWSPITKSVLKCTQNENVYKDCTTVSWRNIVLDWVEFRYSNKPGQTGEVTVDNLTSNQEGMAVNKCQYHRDTETKEIKPGNGAEVFCKIASAKEIGTTIPVVLFDYKTEIGHKASEFDFSKFDVTKLYFRDSFGNGYRDDAFYKTDEQGHATTDVRDDFVAANFKPITIDADDGGLVDFNNKARAKGTAIGGVAGGALGGISAYSGAQDEINERWVTAVREYKDSLQKFVCMTGNRFLSYYNDTVVIPYPQPIE